MPLLVHGAPRRAAVGDDGDRRRVEEILASSPALMRLVVAAHNYAESAFERPLDSQAALDVVDVRREEFLSALHEVERALSVN